MGDNKLDPPKDCNISQDCTGQLGQFCSSFEDNTTESDLLHTFELPISPSQDLFGETTTSSSNRYSPPIGRTTVTTPSCFWKNCESSVHQVCVNTDSGFSSWTGGGDSKARSPSNLISSYCALPHSIFSPLISSDRESVFMQNQSDQANSPWRLTHLNESDISSRNSVTSSGSCLNNLPCASELNEELSDRMFVTSISDMIRNSPTWSTPWTCSNKYPHTYEPCKPVSQNAVDMIDSYPETIPLSDLSSFFSLGLNSEVKNECNDSNSLQSPDDINDKIYKTENFSNFYSKASNSVCTHERNLSTHLFRPIPTHEESKLHGDLFNSSTSSSLVNTHPNRRIAVHPIRSTDINSNASISRQSQHTNCRPRTISYTAYLDSSIRKPQINRPGSAPLQRENLFIPEEDSDSSENNERSEEMKDCHFVPKRRNKKSTSKMSTRRFSQNYQSNSCGHYDTDINKNNFEDASILESADFTKVGHHSQHTNCIYNRATNVADQQLYPRMNLDSNISHISAERCLTNLPLCPDYRSVQYDVSRSNAHAISYSPNYTVAPLCSVISLPTSPMMNTMPTTTNNLNEWNNHNNNIPVLRSTPMPDVVPRFGLHMNNNNANTITSNVTSFHHSILLQPRCSSVPLIQSTSSPTSSSLNPNYSHCQYRRHQQPSDHHHYCDHCNLSSVPQSIHNSGTDMNFSSTSINQIQHTSSLARRLACVADELMIDYSRRNRSGRYNLASGILFNYGISTANYSVQVFWRFSLNLYSLFAFPVDYALRTMRLIISQSLSPQNTTNPSENIANPSINSSNQCTIYSRQSNNNDNDSGAVVGNESRFPPHNHYDVNESNQSDLRNSALSLFSSSFSPTIDSINQTARVCQFDPSTQLSTLSSSNTYPHHHNYYYHHHQSSTSQMLLLHSTGEQSPSSSAARTIEAGHSSNYMAEISTSDSDSN
ncbi:unnamed protein product [Schistosoma rodhaini]|nr:unnamed protein product [Schistosoma rodhaini]